MDEPPQVEYKRQTPMRRAIKWLPLLLLGCTAEPRPPQNPTCWSNSLHGPLSDPEVCDDERCVERETEIVVDSHESYEGGRLRVRLNTAFHALQEWVNSGPGSFCSPNLGVSCDVDCRYLDSTLGGAGEPMQLSADITAPLILTPYGS
jgi:hypothetical protein